MTDAKVDQMRLRKKLEVVLSCQAAHQQVLGLAYLKFLRTQQITRFMGELFKSTQMT